MQNSEENAVPSGHWKALNTQNAEVSTLSDGDSGRGWTATDGRRKEIHCHSCRKEKHLFSEYSPHHVDVFMDISVCINIETHTVMLLHMKSPRKQKLEVAIFSFRKKYA